MNKIYKCICGKKFDKPQQFNGHKQGCKIHLVDKYGSLENYYIIKNRNHDHGKTVQARNIKKKEQELQQWISEKHTCEKCGKVMTEKWGSGRFCSNSCANAHNQSVETRALIGRGVSTSEKFIKNNVNKQVYYEQQKRLKIKEYNKHPTICQICGSSLSYEKRTCKTCCPDCTNEYRRRLRNEYIAENGLIEFQKKGYKYGWYKGYHCDSSWELAYVMYHLDYNIPIERNNRTFFEYTFEGVIHRFFPDFVVDDTYVEIKGMESEQCDCKVRDIPKGIKFKILYFNEIRPYLEYAESTYGKEFYNLYDKDKGSWMDSNKS